MNVEKIKQSLEIQKKQLEEFKAAVLQLQGSIAALEYVLTMCAPAVVEVTQQGAEGSSEALSSCDGLNTTESLNE